MFNIKRSRAHIDNMFLKLMVAELMAEDRSFIPPERVLSKLEPNEMTISEMELELDLLKEVIGIFKGKGPDYSPNTMQEVIGMYTKRMESLEHEILERSLLQYS